jgi:hypothetical protein
MRARTVVVVSALLALACSSSPSPSGPSPAGGSAGSDEGGTGGSPATGGKSGGDTGGKSGGDTGGTGPASGGTGGSTPDTGGAAGGETPDASAAGSGGSAAPDGGGGGAGGVAAGGTALMVVGAIPPIGDDIQIAKVVGERGLKVEYGLDTKVKVADTMGKALVILSYSLDSKRNFHEDFSGIPVPILLMEQGLLGSLGMADMHKWAEPATTITISAPDSPLAAGFPAGDVTVYGKSGEMFWGIPSDQAVKVAIAKGHPTWWVLFAYDKGKMMMTKPAPAKRLQFFMGAHLVPDMFMNASGLKLLASSIDWCVQ